MLLVFGIGVFAVVVTGGIFGFFYAWVCSTMWGLDTLPPQTAIAAMQAMNASVRNPVFAIGFFGTPLILGIAAFASYSVKRKTSAFLFACAVLVYLGGGVLLTSSYNVPMNLELAGFGLVPDPSEAERIWSAYSPIWQFWNQVRTMFSGLALALAATALGCLNRPFVYSSSMPTA